MSLEQKISNLKMADINFADSSRYEFFRNKDYPSQEECEKHAKSITQASEVCSVNSSNAISHSVICSGCPKYPSFIVTFRKQHFEPSERMGVLIYIAFRKIALRPKYHGGLEGPRQHLSVYITPCQLGSSLLGLLPCASNLLQPEIAKQVQLMKSLARYVVLLLFCSLDKTRLCRPWKSHHRIREA